VWLRPGTTKKGLHLPRKKLKKRKKKKNLLILKPES